MNTHQARLTGLVLSAGLAWLTPAAAQPVITSTPISQSPGVFLIQSSIQGMTMNNLLLVRPDDVLLVDTLPPIPAYGAFSTVIHGRTSGRAVGTVINTHWHFDHVGLNSDFRVTEGAKTIIAHWRAGQYLTSPHCIEENLSCMPAFPDTAQPTEGLRGELTLVRGDERVTLKSVENAHSGADLVVYLKQANIVYTGDLYFGGMYPIIDRNGGGTLNGVIHGLNQIVANIDENTIVVPSHGPVGNRVSVTGFVDMLKTCRRRIRALIAQGMSESQVMTDPSFAELDAKWGNGLLNGPLFRMILYRDLVSQRGPDE